MIFQIPENANNSTVLSFLKSTLQISSANLSRLKRLEHGIEVNGQHVTVRYILKTQDVLSIQLDDCFEDVNENIFPVNIPVEFIYQDDNIIIVNKPPYMPTHTSRNHLNDTLSNAVAYVYKQQNIPFVFRPIGRLDRNTSGLVILAKNMTCAGFLSEAMKKEKFKKHYIAILEGRIDVPYNEVQKIHSYIKRTSDSIITRTSVDKIEDGAVEAITYWRLLYCNDNISIVHAMPQTGRTHQLRVHFSSIRHPMVGDDLYGGSLDLSERHLLHAAVITVPMPLSNKTVDFHSYPPQDMFDVVKHATGENLNDIINNDSVLSDLFQKEEQCL